MLDLAPVERQALAGYTQDAGNHVSLEVFPAAALALKILFLADVVGRAGRRRSRGACRGLRDELGVVFCVVNGENARGRARDHA